MEEIQQLFYTHREALIGCDRYSRNFDFVNTDDITCYNLLEIETKKIV